MTGIGMLSFLPAGDAPPGAAANTKQKNTEYTELEIPRVCSTARNQELRLAEIQLSF